LSVSPFEEADLVAALKEERTNGDGLVTMAIHGTTRNDNQILLRQDADPNVHGPDGQTALHILAARGHWPNADQLISKGAEVDAIDDTGRTPLHLAIVGDTSNHTQTVARLLDHHADPNVRDQAGRTPLYYAAEAGNHAGVERLLARKADPTLAAPAIGEPAEAARVAGHEKTADLLQRRAEQWRKNAVRKPGTATYEAEEHARHEGCLTEKDHPGYSGSGFLDFDRERGASITWCITIPETGAYQLAFRYALGEANRPLRLRVDGETVERNLDFPNSGAWDTWAEAAVLVRLEKGRRTITLETIGNEGPNVDYLQVRRVK